MLDSPRASNFKDRVGQQYGRLTVVKFLGIQTTPGRKGAKPNRKSLWLCKCTCGNEKAYLAGSLMTGRTKSCGCLSRETTIEFNKRTKSSYSTFSAVWQSYRRGAIDREYEFSISKEHFFSLTQMNCNYCGRPPAQQRKARTKGKTSSYTYNGIDRINNDLGYTPSNSVPCCGICNCMKKALTYEQFTAHICAIVNHLNLAA